MDNEAMQRKLLNVEQTDSIDSMSYEKESKAVILLLADGMDWSDEMYHLTLLQEKLNNYLWFIESEQYLESFSPVEKVTFRISIYFGDSENCLKLLSNLQRVVQESFEHVTLIIEYGTEKITKLEQDIGTDHTGYN